MVEKQKEERQQEKEPNSAGSYMLFPWDFISIIYVVNIVAKISLQ